MSVILLDTHGSHAAVVKMIASLGSYDIRYYSDTRSAPFDEVSGLTRVSRLLSLLDTHVRDLPSTVVLLGRGMSLPPREAIAIGARRAGIELIWAADLLADHACSVMRPGALCVIGDSCLTEADVRGHLGRNDLFEVPWCRIAPLYSLDEPLKPILKHWGKSVGGYVLATPTNGRFSSQIQHENPDAAIVDEYEHLGLVLASLLPETAKRRVRVSVTELAPTTFARLQQRLGLGDIPITEIGQMESAPMSGPFSMFLDSDGSPTNSRG